MAFGGLCGTRSEERGTAPCPQCQGTGDVPASPTSPGRRPKGGSLYARVVDCPLCGGLARVFVEKACGFGWAGTGAAIVNQAAAEMLEDD